MEPRRPHALDAGLFLLVVALPLALFPLARQPFADPKLLVLLVGALLVWVGEPGLGRRLGVAAAAWVIVLVAATLAGTDAAGSVIGPWDSTGLLLLTACAALVAVAPAIPAASIERTRGWIPAAAVAVAAVAIAWRVAPDAVRLVVDDLDLRGSTLGNPVFTAGFLAAAIPPLIVGRGRLRSLVGVMAVLASAFAVNGERSALLLPVLALGACWVPLRADRRRIAAAGAVLVATVLAWGLVAPALPGGGGLRTASGQFSTLEGEQHRLAVWSANARAAVERPVLGWGPGLGWNAFVASATTEELEVAGRGWADAHSLPLHLLVTTGLLGLAAFAVLAWRLAPGLVRPPRSSGWTAASALTLVAFALYEPVNVVLTPLLFLFAGAANADRAEVRAGIRAVRPALAATLAAAIVVSALALVASSFEQWGRTHFATWAIRRSVQVQPWRLSARERLAIELALDGRAGDPAAAAEARRVIADAVEDHPWDPAVRLIAADVEALLRNPDGVAPWIAAHLERFPNDVTVPEQSVGSGVAAS